MINVKKGIKVEDLIVLLEPFKDMKLEFAREDSSYGFAQNCYGGLDVVLSDSGELTLRVKVD